MYTNILVPISFEEDRDSQQAIEIAKYLAGSEAKITLLHVMEHVPNYATTYLPEGYLENSLQGLKEDLAKRAASISGGQSTVEEHRRLGGNPDIDVAYRYMMYFFEDDDSFLAEINADYRSGKILAGEMKQMCIERATSWLGELHEMRDQTAHLVEEFLASDAR